MGFLGRDRPVSQMGGAGLECNALSTPRKLPFKIHTAWNFAFIVTNANSFFFSLSLSHPAFSRPASYQGPEATLVVHQTRAAVQPR